MPDATRYRFGPFVLHPATRQLLRDGTPVPLPPKAFDVLVLLVHMRDRVVSKEEILDAVWTDTSVIDNTLTQRIREIRDALSDGVQDPRWIKTIPRVGFHFIGEVTEETRLSPTVSERIEPPSIPAVDEAVGPTHGRLDLADGVGIFRTRHAGRYVALVAAVAIASSLAWFIVAPATRSLPPDSRIASLVVLPLENLSRDPQQDYFADGLTEELTIELARISALRVISRTSAVRYKGSGKSVGEIGHELKVDAVVEGSVLRAGSQVRITLKLVEVATERTLLAESYARELQDVLALQSQIARALASRVRVTVTAGDDARLARRVAPEVHDDYLRARSLWNTRTRDGVTQALDLFRRAIEREPAFAEAWAGIADCYITFSGALLGLSEQVAYPRAREAALRALELDETLAEAHTALGSVKSEFEWDWPAAEAEYRRAIELNGNHVTARQWYGEFLSFNARHGEAVMQLRHAVDLDPLSPVVNNSLAAAMLTARRFDEATVYARRTIDIDPTFGGAHMTLGTIYLLQGNQAEAIAALQRAVTLSPGLSKATAWLGHAYAVAGQTARAREILDELDKLSRQLPVSSYDLALIYAGLGDRRLAFEWLDRAYQARAWELVKLKTDIRFDNLHADPSFADLLKRLGLATAGG
jgi:TolB-like protein/DNA-binding winged helix-turn-helix (wHTH) protein/Tfp pilus assembly protein PilF